MDLADLQRSSSPYVCLCAIIAASTHRLSTHSINVVPIFSKRFINFGVYSCGKKYVADGVFAAELNDLLANELGSDGYSGVEIRSSVIRTEIIIKATKTQNVIGDKGCRIREIKTMILLRFSFLKPEKIELYAERISYRGLCAVAQAESLRYKLIGGLVVRRCVILVSIHPSAVFSHLFAYRACYGILRFIMESGAKGCEVVVSGKLRAARAKSMKFLDGFMIHSGQPRNEFIDSSTKHVHLRQGVLGIKVKIMLPTSAEGRTGPRKPLPDYVYISEVCQ